jgi:hypothetical protein
VRRSSDIDNNTNNISNHYIGGETSVVNSTHSISHRALRRGEGINADNLQTSSSERAVTTDTVVTVDSLNDHQLEAGTMLATQNSTNHSIASAGTETFEVARVTPAYATSTLDTTAAAMPRLQHPELHYQTSGDSVTEQNNKNNSVTTAAAATEVQQHQPSLVKTGSFKLIRSRSNTLDGSNIGTMNSSGGAAAGIVADVPGSGSSSRYANMLNLIALLCAYLTSCTVLHKT